MGTVVAKLAENQYILWSNTVDAPASSVLDAGALVDLLTNDHQVSYAVAVHMARSPTRAAPAIRT
jgi:hypothetical protein